MKALFAAAVCGALALPLTALADPNPAVNRVIVQQGLQQQMQTQLQIQQTQLDTQQQLNRQTLQLQMQQQNSDVRMLLLQQQLQLLKLEGRSAHTVRRRHSPRQ